LLFFSFMYCAGCYGWGWGQGGEMTQALYAHMNNKTIKKNFKKPIRCAALTQKK
jgi:hypothetical protein